MSERDAALQIPASEQPPATTADPSRNLDGTGSGASADEPVLIPGPRNSAALAARDFDIEGIRRRAKEWSWEQACTLPLGSSAELADDDLAAGPRDSSAKPPLRPVIGTSTSVLGIYGVGVQLYFEFLVMMGIVYSVRGLLSMPMLILNTIGTGISDFLSTRYLSLLNRSLAFTFLANIGSCPEEGCRGNPQNLLVAPDSRTPLLDAAPWLGGLEAFSSLVNAVFCLYCTVYWIPRTVAKQDDRFVTAADFSVCVSNLPDRLLDDHADYEGKLKRHFEALLGELGVEGPNVVQRVTLVRDYDGALNELLHQGRLNVEDKNERVLAELAKLSREPAKAQKAEARSAKLQEKIASIETAIASCKAKADRDRNVCAAYIMFDREEYKDKVLQAYTRSRSCWARPCQDASLRFGPSRIRVTQATEPADLRWENLDYPRWKRSVRRYGICLLAAAMIVILLMCLVYFRSSTSLTTTLVGRDMWILQPVYAGTPVCARLCNLSLALGDDCSTKVSIRSAQDSDGAVAVDLTTSCWESDVCTTTTLGGAPGWLGVQTDNLSSVLKCISFRQGRGETESARAFQVFGCYSDLMPTHGIAEACVRMSDIFADAPDDDEDARDGRRDSYALRLDTSCGYDVSSITAEHAAGQGAGTADQARQCFCQQQASTSLHIPFFHDDEMCDEWLRHEDLKMVWAFLGMLAVMTLNQVMLFFFTGMGIVARYTTETDAAEATFFSIYCTQFLNTGIVFLVVGMSMNRAALPPALEWLSVFNLGQGEHIDTDQRWFVDTGVTLLVAIACQSIVVNSMTVVSVKVLTPLRTWWVERDYVTEDTLRKLYELPEWQMPLRLAETMTLATCVEMYAGFMPILYWVGAFYCFVAYWVDKWALLAKSKRPFSVGEGPIQFAANILTTATMVHIAMTLWVLGSGVLPSEWGPLTPFAEFYTDMTREESTEILERKGLEDGHDSSEGVLDFLRARLVSCTYASCTGLLLAAIISVVHMVLVVLREVAKQIDVLNAMSGYFQQTRIARWIRSCHLAPQRSDPTAEGFEEASRGARKARVLFSYRMQDNDRYTDICRSLRLHVDAGHEAHSVIATLAMPAKWKSKMTTNETRVKKSDVDDAVEKAYNVALAPLRTAGRVGAFITSTSSSTASSPYTGRTMSSPCAAPTMSSPCAADGGEPAQEQKQDVSEHHDQIFGGHGGTNEPEQGLASAQGPLPSQEGDVAAVPYVREIPADMTTAKHGSDEAAIRVDMDDRDKFHAAAGARNGCSRLRFGV